jgi:hypothetical protein
MHSMAIGYEEALREKKEQNALRANLNR